MYKYCIVPKCKNTTIKTPEKLFFNVPKDLKLRTKWYAIVKRDVKTPPSTQATRHCCEDHFDLEEDMENYIKFKLVGGKLKLKKGVLPHKFECQKTQKKKIDRPGLKKKQDIEYFERVLNKDKNLTEIKEESESGSSTITQAAPKCSTSIPPVRVKRKLSQRAAFVKRLKVAQGDVSRTDEETDYDLFGKSVSSQLKKLSEEQAAIAQESIQSILTQCKLADIRARKLNSDFPFQTPQFTQSMQHVCTQYQSSYQPLKCSPPESSPSGDASFALGFQNTSSDVPDSYNNDNPDEST